MAKRQRVVDNAFLNSGNDVQSIEYNPAAGAQKSLLVGPRLEPIPVASGWTTNAASVVALPQLGMNLAIYNNAGTAGSVTVGKASTVAALAIGAVDASGNVGVACPPNAWTYLSMGSNQYIITNAATLIVYVVEDPTRIVQETGPYAQQNSSI